MQTLRFIENGPNIPDALIKLQEEGNVVFICGAGISRNAGLPDFRKLTIDAANDLGADEFAIELTNGTNNSASYDRIFRSLAKDYGKRAVEHSVTNLLVSPANPELKCHKDILNLSTNSGGRPQVVTTNFDLLFEECIPDINRFVPPYLPDLAVENEFAGVVYLHGRLAVGELETRRNYVLDSADFGRAYMAEGWATKFIKELQSKFCVVIIGYSGDDPPMKYLLDGLSELESNSDTPPIYAFCKSDLAVVSEWRDKGIEPIIFEKHDDLWQTISAWANKSSNIEKWQKSILSMARKSPLQLKPFERGQVVSLVMTKEGAKKFAELKSPPPAEWLCVLESDLRFSLRGGDKSNRLYEISDDPEISENGTNDRNIDYGISPFAWNLNDEYTPKNIRLGFWQPQINGNLPLRLHFLGVWITKILSHPFTIWWAASRNSLNPNLLDLINNQFIRSQLPESAKQFWMYFIEAQSIGTKSNLDFEGYDFSDAIKSLGWNAKTINQFERLVTPFVYHSYRPHADLKNSNSNIDYNGFIDTKIVVREIFDEKIEFPEHLLPRVAKTIRNSLERITDLNLELGLYLGHMSTLLPEVINGDNYLGKKEKLFRLYVSVFDELAKTDIIKARLEYSECNKKDEIFFGKFRLYALSKYQIFDADNTALEIINLSHNIFWDFYTRRELLFAVKENWSGFNNDFRKQILERIIKGRTKPRHINASDNLQNKYHATVQIIGWLKKEGCEIPNDILRKVSKLKSKLIEWSDSWINSAAGSNDSVSGSVRTEEDPSCLLNIKLSQVTETAIENSKRHWGELLETNPFIGLVKRHPKRALSALKCDFKNGKFNAGYAEVFLKKFAAYNDKRLINTINKYLLLIPDADFREVVKSSVCWFDKLSPGLISESEAPTLGLITRIIDQIGLLDNEKVRSNIISTTVGGKKLEKSEYSFGKAINSIGGELAGTIVKLLGDNSISQEIKARLLECLSKLINLDNVASCHAICRIFSYFDWLFHNHKDWTEINLLPLLKVSQASGEAAWHGLAANNSTLNDQVFAEIRDTFISIVSNNAPFKLDKDAQKTIFQILVLRTNKLPANPSFFSFRETRIVLKTCDDDQRLNVIDTICRHSSMDKWVSFTKPFIENAWPKERKYVAKKIASAMISLADKATTEFPDVVNVISPYLTQIEYLHGICFKYAKDEFSDKDFDHARIYPKETLNLLNLVVPNERHLAPYALSQTIDAIGEAAPSVKRTEAWKRLKAISI